ncbi:hypothetical protein BROUX41_003359 [Berkeleyomyces rouxiae]
MLEGLVAGILNRFLGMYVKNFDPGQLKVGIWSGDVKLRDLELRREALDQLKLPINVFAGHLGELTLVIPWSNLRGAPVKVLVEDVFLLASPKEQSNYDPDEEDRRQLRLKMERLDSAEMLQERNREGLSQEEEHKTQSFTQSLITKIMDNVQVQIKNIHIRYEDSVSAPNHPFALGITLQEFSAVTTDGSWKPMFMEDSHDTTHKLASLEALTVYWNTDTELLGTGRDFNTAEDELLPHLTFVEKCKLMIANHENEARLNHQYILRPVSGQAKLQLDKTGNRRVPRFHADLLFDEIGLVLDDEQYRDGLMLVDLFHHFFRHQEYLRYQPKVSVKQDPLSWFRFAGNAVLTKIHERNRKWSWEFFKERRDDRLRYIELFKKAKQGALLEFEEEETFQKLETKLGYEDLRFWRSLARNQMRKERTLASETQRSSVSAHSSHNQQQQRGWMSWVWGSKPSDEAQQQQEEQDQGPSENTHITEEQRQELYDAIDWNERTALAETIDVPRDSIKLKVESSLRTGSFTLRRKRQGKFEELMSLHFDAFKACMLQRVDSFLAQVTLGGFRVNDSTTPHSLYPEIVRVKDALPFHSDNPAMESSKPNGPLFYIELENNPIEREGDIALVMKLKPLEIIWNPHFVVGISEFFRPPERHMESINALMESAGATVVTFREQTRASLEYALEEHKAINANLDLQAPLIIIPLSVTTESSQCLIVDAGHVNVASELADKEMKNFIQAKQRQVYTDEDLKRLESAMYDRFSVKLSSTQVLIGPSIDIAKQQLANESDFLKLHIVDRINIDLTVEISILPKAPNLTRIKVHGHLPMLHATLSDQKYKTLMRAIDVAIPRLENGASGASVSHIKQKSRSGSRRGSQSSFMSALEQPLSVSTRRPSLFLSVPPPVIMEDDVHIENNDNPSPSSEFKTKFSSEPSEQSQFQQRNFQFTFKIDYLKGSLCRSDPTGQEPDQLLVEMTAEDFNILFYNRPCDMVAQVSLGSVTVDDFVVQDSPPEFKSILFSGDTEDLLQKRSLVQIKYTKVSRDSPEFKSVYEGIETNLSVSVSTINLIVTRKTLLTLLDFTLTTFSDNNNPVSSEARPSPRPRLRRLSMLSLPSEANLGSGISPTIVTPTPLARPTPSTKIKAELKSIRLILNNDGVRLATLSLNHADVGLFMVGPVMRLHTKLGNFSLVDDISVTFPNDSPMRQLISVHGDDLADFRYETFDSNNINAYPGYDSSLYFRAGSIKVMFVQEPFRDIVAFAVKFGQMQALYNAARQAAASQATQIQQSNSRMKYDMVISTPIVSFPRLGAQSNEQPDVVVAYLGEIYAQNRFVTHNKEAFEDIATVIKAGIRNIRLTSDMKYPGGRSEELEMIDHVDLIFKVTSVEQKPESLRPDIEIESSMSDFNLRLTQFQIQFLLEVLRSVPTVFASSRSDDPDISIVSAIATSTPNPLIHRGDYSLDEDEDIALSTKDGHGMPPLTSLGPELRTDVSSRVHLDLIFRVKTIGLDLIAAQGGSPVVDLNATALSRFSLNESEIKFKMVSDSSMEGELLIQSFIIHDLRSQNKNKFRRIMSPRSEAVKQLMSTVSVSGGNDRTMILVLTLDSPRLIFSLDYLFAVNNFLAVSLQPSSVDVDARGNCQASRNQPKPDVTGDVQDKIVGKYPQRDPKESVIHGSDNTNSTLADPAIGNSEITTYDRNILNFVFRVNVVDSQLILIADPLTTSSEAIVLGTRQVLLSKQNSTTFQISEISMFLCKMDRFDSSRLRVLDDFSVQVAIENSTPGLTSIDLAVDPLILRLSFRDIHLILQILAKASELSNDNNGSVTSNDEVPVIEDGTGGSSSKTVPSPNCLSSVKSQGQVSSQDSLADRNLTEQPRQRSVEKLRATFSEVRLVLIGEGHELPMLDTALGGFTAHVDNWSTDLKAGVTIEMYANVYNFSKSAWEPLIEPWRTSIDIERASETGTLVISMDSSKTFDITITTATVQLAMASMGILSRYQQAVEKPRGAEAPYRLRNYTGFGITVTSQKTIEEDEPILTHLDDGEETPWSFEPWEKMREMVSSDDHSAAVQITLEGSGFDPIHNVTLNREGEFLFALRPRVENVLHRLMVEVVLEPDYVKYVTIRSPLVFENNTQIPLEIGVFDVGTGDLLKIEKIAPGAKTPAPIGAAYSKSMLLRPDSGFGYEWSTAAIGWRDMITKPTRTIVCKGEGGESFYFQVAAQFDKTNLLVRNYPYMTIKVSPPITLENLLPHDFKYRIYDKTTQSDWSNFLRKGGVSPIHVVELSHLLLLNIDMQDSVFKPSDFAIINSGASSKDFSQERRLICRDSKGLNLSLNLLYEKIPDGGGAFKVTIYTPYVILNKTGMELLIRARGFMQSAKVAAGQLPLASSTRNLRDVDMKAQPLMFSFDNDDHRNRAFLKLGTSDWSKPQSFDAAGSSTEVVLPSNDSSSKNTEISIGLAVESGIAKYRLTKIVTISPRFIIINKLDEDLQAREPSSSGLLILKPRLLEPLRFMSKSPTKQLCLSFPGINNPWSSAFNLSDLGTNHIKISKNVQGQKLIRIEILIEGATVFVHLVHETGNWPFSMRNESSAEFTFWQANPYIDEDGIEIQSGWKPIKYRLPARSMMPYAWDFPAAASKEVIICAQGSVPGSRRNLERHVQLSEIGTQLPMKYGLPNGSQEVIDISVAADGPTQTLILSNYKPSKTRYKKQGVSHNGRRDSVSRNSTRSANSNHDTGDKENGTTFSAHMNLSGVAISLINSSHKELAYVTFRGVQLRYHESLMYQTASLGIKWIQIDNQLYGGVFPMLLFPSVVPKKTKEIEAHPSLHMMITRLKDESYGLLYVKYATVLLQEMTIELDEDFLYAIMDFADSSLSFISGNNSSWAVVPSSNSIKLCEESLDIPQPKVEQAGHDIYFEVLNIQPMQLNISFMRTQVVNTTSDMGSHNPVTFFINMMTMAIGNVNDAPIRFNALLLENVRVSVPVLIQNVTSHYTQEALYQVHKILGSADFLGNPVGLFNNISSGITDIFYEPYQGLILNDNAEEFTLGLAKGATSFIKKSVYGFSDSFSKVTGSVAKGLALATLDKQFQDRRRITRARNRPKHALYGVTAGANSLLTSVASGVGGLAKKPWEGAEQEGALGFLKGVGKGVIGFATKPAIGVLDLASNVSEGIRNTTTVFDGSELEQVRKPRFIPSDGIVRPFNEREALGQYWLKQVDNGRFFDENYIAHLELPREDLVVLVTFSRILVVWARKLNSEWDIPLKEIQTISKERTGISVVFKGGANGPFIPVTDESGRTFLYRMVAVAVEEFNRKFRTQ